ncbi:unnamed protein product [Eruca vesicaria subsp. sativa]|uniref:Uncharacterized protein n=1 Tax=Eruca vesicaria subsp. sativa TaxID=29727 RepID=A0ABC8JHF9_ERUVS|nr:unnamed protein product [Eruca vesicaria subsp. sativa]
MRSSTRVISAHMADIKDSHHYRYMRDNKYDHSRSARNVRAWESRGRSNRHNKSRYEPYARNQNVECQAKKQSNTHEDNLTAGSEKGATGDNCAIVSYEQKQGSSKRAYGDSHQHDLENLKEGDALMGTRLASVIVSRSNPTLRVTTSLYVTRVWRSL